MIPNGRRAWRRAAKKLRRVMGRRWRSPDAKWCGKRWSELVPNLEAHRGHITGAWFKRHGITEQGLQTLHASHLVRVYVGLWGAVEGDYVTYDASPRPFTPRSLVGMTQGARKRAARRAFPGGIYLEDREDYEAYRIGQKVRPCAGCALCQLCAYCGKPSTCIGLYEPSHETQKPKPACDECCAHGCEDGHCDLRADDEKRCDGSGVLPARKAKR